MIDNKLFEVLKDFKLHDIETASQNIKSLTESDINQISKAIDSNSISIEESQKYFNKNNFNVLTNRYLQFNSMPDLIDSIQKMLLYVDKIIFYNQFGFLSTGLNKGVDLKFIKKQFIEHHLPILLNLQPLIENNILYFVKPTEFFNKYGQRIETSAIADIGNKNYRNILANETNVGTLCSNPEAIDLTIGTRKALVVPPLKIGHLGFATFSFKIGEPVDPKPLSFIDNNSQAQKSVNNIYLQIAKELNSDILLSNFLNAYYVTNNTLDWNLLHSKLESIDRKSLKLIPSIMQLDLKFLKNISYNDIIKIRSNTENTFEDFRLALSQAFESVNEMPDTTDFKNKVDKIKTEEIEPKIRILDKEFKRIEKHRLTRMITISVASLVASFLPGGFIPVAAAGSAGFLREYAEWNNDNDKLKNNSMYFLWKLKNAS